MIWKFLFFISIVSTLHSAAMAHPAPKIKTFSKQDLAVRLKERANPDSVATDPVGAWIGIYQYVFIAKKLDRSLYETALLQLDADAEGCGAKTERSARLSCAINNAADVASSLTLFAAAIELRKDAVAYAESVSDRGPLLDVLIDLASDELLHGSLAGLETAVERIDSLIQDRPELLDIPRRFRIAVSKAKLADAQLDDTSTLKNLSDAVEAATQQKSGAISTLEKNQVGGRRLTELVAEHFRGQFCKNCGPLVAEPVKKWVDAVLTGQADEDPNEGFAQSQFMLFALTARDGVFSSDELAKYARHYIRQYAAQGPAGENDVRSISPTLDLTSMARVIASAAIIESGDFNATRKIINEHDKKRQSAQFRNLLEKILSDNFEQLGGDSDIPYFLDNLSRHFAALGYQNLSRTILQYMMDQKHKIGESAFQKQKHEMAATYVPALARLASLNLSNGNEKLAAQQLDEASALATEKLSTEWNIGGADAVLLLRQLAPALRLIAQKRSEVVTARGVSAGGRNHEALFQSMQVAMLGETAIALAVADQRRFLSDPSTRDLRQRFFRAAANAEQAAEITEYAFESGDVDGVLAKLAQDAADERESLRRAFEEKVPVALTAKADIEPVRLTQAASHLRDGEAAILLHVGSHAIHGFLLDKLGQSYAWRTAVRREDVEALVRSVRTGGDVSKGPFPLFPYSDAAKLYDVAFGPIANRLGAYRRLVIIGDGPLQAMPYSALLTKAVETPPKTADEMRRSSLPWLIRSHAIALIPSVRSLVTQRASIPTARSGKPFLGIGDPKLADAGSVTRSVDVAGALGTNTGLADVATLRSVASLPETAEELRAIAKLLGSGDDALLLGEKANEAAIRSMPLSEYRLIAFATHGALAGEVTGTREPGLVLTPPEQASREDDGFLALSEIVNLRLDADLVLLSACNTGTSDGRPRAEGLSGLARGFFSAGARSLVITHWYIPSESASAVTVGLIAQRKQNPEFDWAEAHRAATIALIDKEGPAEWAHPAYWGGFAVVGVMPSSFSRN